MMNGYSYIQNQFNATGEITGNTPILNTQMRPISPHAEVDDIAVWIFDLANGQNWENPDHYAELFRQKGIDGRKIFRLDNKDLRDSIKISKLGHRLKILQAIKKW